MHGNYKILNISYEKIQLHFVIVLSLFLIKPRDRLENIYINIIQK